MSKNGSSSDQPPDITQLLRQWNDGDEVARNEALNALYPDMKRLAKRQLIGSNVTLSPTGLVAEGFMKLCHQQRIGSQDRHHFLRMFAVLVRRTFIDYLRQNRRSKRGGDITHLQLDTLDFLNLPKVSEAGWIAFPGIVERLEREDPDAFAVFELRVFAGLEIAEIAKVLNLSVSTIVRRWRFARAWVTSVVREE